MDKIENNLPRAVNMVYSRPDGKVLAIQRKFAPLGIGLIGGKLEKNESEIEALIREVKEESGLYVIASQKVFEGLSATKKYIVSTYQVLLSGTIKSSNEGEIIWTTVQDLVDGPFGEYNCQLFLNLGCEFDCPKCKRRLSQFKMKTFPVKEADPCFVCLNQG